MSSAPPSPPNQWEELNRPRSEQPSPPPPAPPQPVSVDQPAAPETGRSIDPFVLLGVGAVAFVLLAGGFMVLGGFIGSSNEEASVTPPEPTPTSASAVSVTTAPESQDTAETTTVADSPLISFDVPPDLNREQAAVFRLYLLIFGREPDASGLEYWSGELASGTPLGEMAQQLMSTDEFVAEYGERPSQEQLLDLAHLRIYGRPPTDQERAFWDGLGVEGIEFLIAFSNSPEARQALGTR